MAWAASLDQRSLTLSNMSPEEGCACGGAQIPALGRGLRNVTIRLGGSSVPGSEVEEDLDDVRAGGPVAGEVLVAGLRVTC